MQDSGAPTKIQLPWGAGAGSAYINAVPVPSQIGIVNGRASWTDGFVPLNMTSPLAGGVPPFGQDMNGALNQISAGVQWLQAGGAPFYDSAFQSAVGGYPKGAVVASVAYPGVYWYSQADNNTSNPDSAGTNWTPIYWPHGSQAYTTAGAHSFTVPAPQIAFQIWAGGGGSGATSGAGSGSTGGGGAEYRVGLLTGLTVGASVTVTVGAGGTAGSGTGNGGAGGNSSFASSVVANGGGGGFGANGGLQPTNAAGGTGGTGGTGVPGTASGLAFLVSSGTYMASFGGGAFGTALLGPIIAGSSAAALPGIFPGGGATGALNGGTGGAGASGMVLLFW